MQKMTWTKRLSLLLVLAALLLSVVPAMAQDATQEAEHQDTTETAEAEHGEAAASPLEPLGINAGYLIVQIVNFLIVFGGLSYLLWGRAVKMLDARTSEIEKGLNDAAAAAKARLNAEADAEKILADARAAAAKEIADARVRGEEVGKSIQAEARTAAGTEADRIRAEAQAAQSEQLSGMRDQVLGVAVALAGRIINENLDAKKQQALVSDFFSKVPASAKSLSGKIEVVSAMPLSAEEQAKAKSEIGASDVTFTVDPAILGGLVVKSADRVIDGSVKSGLGDLAGRLN